jgi:hypothetical protein
MGLAAHSAALILAHSIQIYDTVNDPAAGTQAYKPATPPREPG